SALQHPPHARVAEVDAGAVHHRTGPGDDADVVLPAVFDCCPRDARSCLHRLMHPDATHAGIATVLHDPFSDFRPRDDDHRVETAGDRLDIRVTAISLERVHPRIQCE